ncbi:hypothetical protein T484DRAFT_1861512 [Baffinella frigidus]|nr:hypothetical protein T484DRAFT_1861512 [Cryptophyta sp. CCMP2293]
MSSLGEQLGLPLASLLGEQLGLPLWAPLVATVISQQGRLRLLKHAVCQELVLERPLPPAPRRGRGGTVGAGTRPGGKNHTAMNFLDTKWGKMLANDAVKDPRSKLGRLFRRRFRVPHPVFLKLAAEARERFASGTPDTVGRVGLPLEAKILGWLRTLGRASCFDDVSELSNLGESTAHAFFHEFNEWMVEKYKPAYLSPPTDDCRGGGISYEFRGT